MSETPFINSCLRVVVTKGEPLLLFAHPFFVDAVTEQRKEFTSMNRPPFGVLRLWSYFPDVVLTPTKELFFNS